MATANQLARAVQLVQEFTTRDYHTFAGMLHYKSPEGFAMLSSALEKFALALARGEGPEGKGSP